MPRPKGRGIFSCWQRIACYNGDTPKTGEDDRPMQRPTPKLQWEGTGLTAHCLSYPRSFWQTVSRPSHLRKTLFMVASTNLQLSDPDNPIFRFMDKKRAEVKHFTSTLWPAQRPWGIYGGPVCCSYQSRPLLNRPERKHRPGGKTLSRRRHSRYFVCSADSRGRFFSRAGGH